MDEALKDKLKKIQELVNRGATEGERNAAKKAFDRIVKKYAIDDDSLKNIAYKNYVFKYALEIEKMLLVRLINFFLPHVFDNAARGIKYVRISMMYNDWVVLDCSYEYFRRHMKKEHKKIVLPELNKYRKAKTRNAARKLLDNRFFTEYCIKSELVKKEHLITTELKPGTKEYQHAVLMQSIEGGRYNKQVVSNYLLEN